MLYYQGDKRYIIQKNARTGKTTQTLGPYEPDMIPEIKNNDGTERSIHSIPKTSEESVQYQYENLRNEFIRFTDLKHQNLTLKDVKKDCNYTVEWQCSKCGNIWVTKLQARTTYNSSCGFCDKTRISFPEKYLFYQIQQQDHNLQENYKIPEMNNMEFDMYDPILKFAIEFQSGDYHSNRQDADKRKLQYALSQNIRLIRIWQLTSVKQVDRINKDEYVTPIRSSISGVSDLNIIIDDICKQYDLDQSLIDRKQAQDQAFIRTNKEPPAGESLFDLYPDICRDWDYSKNGVIRPEMIYPRSGIKVHWKCMYCHKEWITQPYNRTSINCNIKAGCKQCHTKMWRGTLQEIPYIPNNKTSK